MAFLEIDKLQKRYGSVEVLKNISLEVEEGGFLVLVGPSGCGKSTLLNTIAGLEEITGGDLRINGKSMNGVHPSERDIAMVFQSYALYPNMNVRENIGFGMEMRKVPRAERDQAIADVAKMLQIDHLLDRRPGQLSGGQRQRVAMGRALVRKPQVFLFDEPLSNLDAKLRVEMRTEIKRLHQSLGRTMVYVTHDQIEAMTLATKIAVLKDGVLQQVGTPQEIYRDPVNTFVADFMGSPAMNLVRARVGFAGDKPVLGLKRREGEIALELDIPAGKLASWKDKEIILGIRPENITEFTDAQSYGPSVRFCDVMVDVVEPAGADTFMVTHLGGKEVIGRLAAEASARSGEMLRLAVNTAGVVLFDPDKGTRLH
ncbi:ABC transporter ATP-binding protein [Radicibacter daui]|uniref:ABC transporter ATP-binding protein n=1 Tax=Radicibacter daui TaxID=3064829 RepID=UPI0040468B90